MFSEAESCLEPQEQLLPLLPGWASPPCPWSLYSACFLAARASLPLRTTAQHCATSKPGKGLGVGLGDIIFPILVGEKVLA